MRIHIVAALFLAFLCTLGLSGCSTEIPLITTDGDSYEVRSAVVTDQYAGRVPSEGTQFLLISIQGSDSELDKMQSTFYGKDQKAMVSDGVTTAECTLIVYAPQPGDKLDVVLLFQVPLTFAEDFSLYGDSFESVALNIER